MNQQSEPKLAKGQVHYINPPDLHKNPAFTRLRGNPPNPPANSLAIVARLVHPDFLAEMDAIAVVTE